MIYVLTILTVMAEHTEGASTQDAPWETEITYTFYLPSDPWGNRQGFYVVGLTDDTYYEIYQFNHYTTSWYLIGSNTINKREVGLHFENMQYGYIYKLLSTNAMLVVVTSMEGSNVAVATPDCDFVGTEFTFIGDLYSRLQVCRTTVFALEDNTEISMKYTRAGETTPFATYETVLDAGEYEYIEQSSSGTVIIDLDTTKEAIVYRLAGDNDELDVVIATTGTPFGNTFYFAEPAGFNDIFYLYNRADTEAEVVLLDITDSANPVTAWSGTVEPRGMTHVYFGGTEFAHTWFWKIESTQPLFVLGGGYIDWQLNPGQHVYFGLDSYHRFFSLYENKYIFKTNMLYSNGLPLVEEFMMFVVTTATEMNITPSIPVINNQINYILAGNITAGITDTTTIELTITGTVDVKLDGNLLGTYQTGTAEITLQSGSHTLTIDSASSSSTAELAGINLDHDSCLVWNLGHVPSTAGPLSHHIWTFEADDKVQFYHGGNGNCWVLTVMPMLYDYNIELRSGEAAGMQQHTLVHYVDPGESTMFRLQAWNLGMEKDSIELYCAFTYASPSEGWYAALSHELVGPLNGSEYANFTLTVYAPSIGVSYGDFSIVTIYGESVSDANVTDTISAVTIINISVDFVINVEVPPDAHTGEKLVKISPDAQKIITMSITNLGNVNDTYDLTLMGIPPGWEITFANNKHTMNISLCAMKYSHLGSAEALPIIILHAPVGAVYGDTAKVTIVGVSRLSLLSGTKPLERSDSFTVMVEESKTLKMSCDDYMKYVDPGDEVHYAIKITNLGNMPVDVALYAEGLQLHNWSVEFVASTVHLNPQQYTVAKLIVGAPETSRANERLVLIVVGKVIDDPSITATLELITIVNQIHKFTVTVVPRLIFTEPGTTIDYNLTLTNLGNGEETFALTALMLDMTWNYAFLRNRNSLVSMVCLAPEKFTEVTFRVTVPPDALVDAEPSTARIEHYRTLINVSTKAVWSTVMIATAINPVYDANIICETNNQTIDPGNPVPYTIKICSDSNTYMTIHLSINAIYSSIGIPCNWLIYIAGVALVPTTAGIEDKIPINFSLPLNLSALPDTAMFVPLESGLIKHYTEINITLPARAICYVTIVVIPERTTVTGIYVTTIDIYCIETADKFWDNFTAFITCVLNSDLTFIGELIRPSKVMDGEIVTLSVQIKNIGEIGATDVIVRLYVNDNKLQDKFIGRIEPGKTRVVVFVWHATSGTHDIKIVVDPENEITEVDETNNVRICNIKVEAKSGILLQKAVPVFLIGLLIIAIIIAFALVLKAFKRRERLHKPSWKITIPKFLKLRFPPSTK
jgi:uncharacterized membrane protein